MIPATDLVEVRLLGLPLTLLIRARQHGDELRREFQHIAAPVADSDAVPDRLLNISRQLVEEYGAYTAAADREIEAALARGDATIDLTMRVPASAASAAAVLDGLYDEVDEFCRQGELLTLATPDDLVRLRRWYFRQFIDQINGQEPVPWSQFRG